MERDARADSVDNIRPPTEIDGRVQAAGGRGAEPGRAVCEQGRRPAAGAAPRDAQPPVPRGRPEAPRDAWRALVLGSPRAPRALRSGRRRRRSLPLELPRECRGRVPPRKCRFALWSIPSTIPNSNTFCTPWVPRWSQGNDTSRSTRNA